MPATGHAARLAATFALGATLLTTAGCDSLRVRPFAGALIEMTIAGVAPTPEGTHLELWARDQNDDILRVNLFSDVQNYVIEYGLQVRLAIDPNDPCMIATKGPGAGNFLTSAAAYQTIHVAGITQTPEEQALQVKNRLDQILSTGEGGQQSASLLAIVAATDDPAPTIPVDASPADRLTMCQAYWAQSKYGYTGNPYQLTAPLHGAIYGFVTYTTTTPPAGYDGIRLETPVDLEGLKELWLTTETRAVTAVDPVNRGDVFLHSTPAPGGRDVVFFNLSGPTASGTAALYVDLDNNKITF